MEKFFLETLGNELRAVPNCNASNALRLAEFVQEKEN